MRIPKLCRHRSSLRAYVTDPATGKPVYFGKWGTAEARTAYGKWVADFVARRPEDHQLARLRGRAVTMAGLVEGYLAFAETYYRKGGKVTAEVASIKNALAWVGNLYPLLPAAQFRPGEFKALRAALVGHGLARTNINKMMARIKRMVRWAVEEELVEADVLGRLIAVSPLTRGRTAAPDPEEIQPVPLAAIHATLKHCRPITQIMVKVHLWTAMRPAEVCEMRPEEIDMYLSPWLYRPASHKTEHRGKTRKIWLGPQCQEILRPLLQSRPDGWVFPGSGRGSHADYFGPITVSGYRQRIHRACLAAGIQPWCPLQIRHTALSIIRSRYGLEAAQVVAGHSEANTTEIYAERDETLARKVATEMDWGA